MAIKLPLLLQGGFFTALLVAACFWDIRKRTVPDILCLLIAITGLLTFEPGKLWGILAGVPFLIGALIQKDGMGGGDIKLMAAAGFVLGLRPSMTAIVVGFLVLSLFYGVYAIIQKLRVRDMPRAYPLAPFLSLGCLMVYFIH
ncbi:MULTISPECIES: A24 family peptidase [unclassified Dehalobacter]|jgi:leader peptidase (prepilin peptidase)/N-methyltransferase|uniref:prepilin peptidase n=1 Tax=unclassified Dehalobacter TaxID=2635733 RepID=UPI000E6D10B8|nr:MULTISPECIES: A24 family peptidase [unclassified Dehalobacter]RJE46607.1 peptidase A24 [Dehalobacter sp. MCB1]TCX47375.1 prepilin peptidase [Dehalobacter sp. 14DCB1]TCX55588.1 prepilin peptidase [Dehalobacter sp. 12DCB1]